MFLRAFLIKYLEISHYTMYILTRSQSAVIINFDEASDVWRQNKITKGNGTYTYNCNVIMRNGCDCRQPSDPSQSTCKRHSQKRI